MLTTPISFEQISLYLGIDASLLAVFIIALTLWSVVWKAWALWLSARRGEKWWFILLLIVNTIGILEIIYIFLIAKKSDKPKLG